MRSLDDIKAALASVPDPVSLMEALFAFSPVGLQIFTREGRSLVVNQAFLDLFGSRPPPEYSVLDDDIAMRTGIYDLVLRAFAGEVVKTPPFWYDPRELTHVTVAEGKRVAIVATLFPLFDQDHQVQHVGIVFTDVTAETRARERSELLARAAELFADTLDTAHIADALAQVTIPALGDACSVVYQNEAGAFVRVADAAIDPAIHASVRELRGSVLAEPAAEIVRQAYETGKPALFPDYLGWLEQRLGAGHGYLELVRRVKPRSSLIVPFIARGRPLGALMISTIGPAARIHGEDEVKLASELATRAAMALDNARHYEREVAAVRVRDEFLSVASHELRTPLTTLALHAESIERALVRTATPPRPPLDERVRKMRRQIARLEQLIGSLLSVTRLARDAPQPMRRAMDLRDLALEVVERFTDEAAAAGSALALVAPASTPGEWDPFHLDQVLTNLVTNAIKYGGGKPIRVEIAADEQHAIVRVIDGGIGVAPADHARVFQRFERAASPRHYGGLGLGLWIVRRLVEAHGGTIRLDSALDRGATFEVRLPRAPSVSR